MIASLFGWAIKLFGGGIIEKALDAFTKSEDIRVRGKEIDAETVKEAMRMYVQSQANQNEVQKAKLEIKFYWLLVALFIIPLGVWWTAVLADSTFNLPISVANLPTPELREWAGQMISFLFYTGGTVLGIKALLK